MKKPKENNSPNLEVTIELTKYELYQVVLSLTGRMGFVSQLWASARNPQEQSSCEQQSALLQSILDKCKSKLLDSEKAEEETENNVS